MSPGEIHEDHPFTTPLDMRDPVRRFRGRLAAPVTVATAGTAHRRAGLTVSSLLVADGAPSFIHLLVGSSTDLWDAIRETGAFIVHVLEAEHRELSDRFAFVRPSPGGLFAGIEVVDTDHGPELSVVGTRAYCRYAGHFDDTYHALVHGIVEAVVLDDIRHPLQYFRGEYFHG
ncbi:MAG: flavin reductase family protein [Actinobacteria bacterium]|nr:flavin reductase family protein [Actinomycetota bacterium]